MKNFRKFLHYLASPFVLGCLVTFTMVYGAYLYYSRYQDSIYNGESTLFDLVREAHQKTIDYRMIIRGPVTGHPDVAILAIDEPSLEQEGRWPWPREKIGQVVEKAIGYGAKTIAFDIIFAEEDSNSSKPVLSRLEKSFEEKKALTPELKTMFSNEKIAADSDKKFGEVIQRNSDHLLMGAYFEEFDVAGLERISPHFDACIDTLYARSPAATYWNKDKRRPVVVDNHAAKQALPAPLADHLNQYFSMLEATQISNWLGENPDIDKKIKSSLAFVGLPEDMPSQGLIFDYLAGNKDSVVSGLSQMLEQDFPMEKVDELFAAFSTVLNQKQRAIIQSRLRNENLQYCFRFMMSGYPHPRNNDELLVKASLEERYRGTDLENAFDQLSWESVWTAAKEQKAELPTNTFGEYLTSINETYRRNHITPVDRWWLNIPALAAGTNYTSFFNAHLDTDGTVRKNMFLARRGNTYFTSLALGSFLLSRNLHAAATIMPLSDSSYKGVEQKFDQVIDNQMINGSIKTFRDPAASTETAGFRITNEKGESVMTVPVDPGAKMLINYSGPKWSFAHINAGDILNDKETATIKFNRVDPVTGQITHEQVVNKKEFLKDKILFFGATATGIYDLRVTPFEENFPGVETHANMLSNLLVEYARATGQGDKVKGMPGFLRTFPELEAKLMLPGMLVFGLIFSALLSYFGSIAGLAVTTATLGGVYAFDRFILFDSGIVTTVLLPFTLIMTLFVTLTFYKYFTEERKKRQLKGTFAKYVSPAIVDEILSDPENIELGGKKMELTVMFSDVRGFTTISEKLDPRALSDLLNSYLTPMTNLVFENKGTLDKYMGDAIMAFWGAPVHFVDHATHACRCALQMLVKLKELQAQYEAQGLPSIDIGIGLNTGEMSVGNMGSDTVRSYTVMGDAVNLGSRLEGINKQYGTRIIISEFTQKAVEKDFVCREIDWVRVKGKAQPVKIFELVGEKNVDEKTKTLMVKFESGIHAYHKKQWDDAIALFTECLHISPEDEPSQLYLERCQEYKNNPPPEDWDGVFTMTTK